MTVNSVNATHWIFCLALAAVLLAGGCASKDTKSSGASVTASNPAHLTQSGFLSDYARLETVSWTEGIQCWRQPDLDARKYDKVLISRMTVTLKPDQQQGIDPTDLKTMIDYFHNAMVKAIEPQMQVVEEAGPGVLGIRIALTNLVPTRVSRSLTGTLVPCGFVAEAGSGEVTRRPAGSTPYPGETGMEMQFIDGASGAIVAECRDTEIGRKYAAETNSGALGAAQTWASGYVNSFQSWAYAKNAFDKWSVLTANRLAELPGVGPAE